MPPRTARKAPAEKPQLAGPRGANRDLEENLVALFNYVQRVRTEIASLNHAADGIDKFASMTEQLDGVIEATADATDTIMDAMEKNDAAMSKLQAAITDPGQAKLVDELAANNSAASEACAFQDLTGQRVNEIIKSLSYVEERVNALRKIWGDHELDAIEVPAEADLSDDELLLHGPQSKNVAISQAEIDKLFE